MLIKTKVKLGAQGAHLLLYLLYNVQGLYNKKVLFFKNRENKEERLCLSELKIYS
jgi:hypothetical protein